MDNNKKNSVGIVFTRLITIIMIIVLFIILAAAMINAGMVWTAGRYIITADEAAEMDADCILVLGAQVFSDGTLSSMLEDRVETGMDLYRRGASSKILMSGDHGAAGYDEVNSMKTYAVDGGVPPENVFMDHAGFSTYESVYRAQYIFGAKKVIIVTQKYHLYRAIYAARALGIDAYGVPADMRDYKGAVYNNLREALARCKDFFMAVFKPAPTYLGDEISLDGSGAVTDDEDSHYDYSSGS